MNREFAFQQRIYVEDTDCSGMVYHSNYLKYMERARTEVLAEIGCGIDRIAKSGCFFCVVTAEINYKKPATLNQIISIISSVPQRKKSTLTFTQGIYLADSQELLCEGVIQLACVNPAMKPIAIPTTIQEALA